MVLIFSGLQNYIKLFLTIFNKVMADFRAHTERLHMKEWLDCF